MDPMTIKGVWGFNGTERPGAVYLASVLATHAQKGLVGQTVGSQVLLVIPPDQAYGDKEQGSIPANSTLVFVIDILAAY